MLVDRGPGFAHPVSIVLPVAGERAVVQIDVGAIKANVEQLRTVLDSAGPRRRSRMCAVVKADGYGHGAPAAAMAALAGRADFLAVATASEAEQLRRAGVREVPILVLGPLTNRELEVALAADADVVASTPDFVARLPSGCRIHVKLDTGMGRYGTRSVSEADRMVELAGDRLTGVMTHFATADDFDDDGFFERQLAAFLDWAGQVKANHAGILVHAANSAATLRRPTAHLDMCRCGIAIYGVDPFHRDAAAWSLRPALSVRSYVAVVKRCGAGESVGYGRRFVARSAITVATLPIGYGDGLARALGGRWSVLIGDRECPIVGNVSMDAITVRVPDGHPVHPGEEALILGGPLTAESMARALGTIPYEVTTRMGRRPIRVEVGRSWRPNEVDDKQRPLVHRGT